MRGTIPGLPTPHPLLGLLPAVYQEEDEFLGRWTAGLDDVLAPVLSTLDCLDSYVDPSVAPEDFLLYIAGWVGASLDENTPLPLQRFAVAQAAALHRNRGTVAGLRASLELLTGSPVDVVDSGGVSYSASPGSAAPGTDGPPWLSVKVRTPELLSAVDTAVAAAKPAHIAHTVEVV